MRRFLVGVASVVLLAFAGASGYGLYHSWKDARIVNFDTAPPSRALRPRDGIAPEVGFVRTTDGLALRYARFAPAGPARETIVVVPGKGDSAEDYQELINAFVASGYQAFSLDLRSQGLSGRMLANPQKIHIDRFETHAADLRLFIDQVVKPRQVGSLTLLAHSMGAPPVLIGLVDNELEPDRLVLMAPMIEALRLPHDGWKASLIRALAWAYRATGNGGAYFATSGDWSFAGIEENDNVYTIYPEGLRRWFDNWAQEPRLVTGGVTASWVAAYYDATDRLRSLPDRSLMTPTVLALAENDGTNSNPEAQRFCEQKMTHCAVFVLAGQKHDLEMAAPDTLTAIVRRTDELVASGR